MNMAEFFSGSGQMAEVFEENGHETFTTDIEKDYFPSLAKDIMALSLSDLPFRPDIVWASVPCNRFSVASIGRSWTGGKGAYTPKNDETRKALAILERTIMLISQIRPKYWFIENPRGVMRKVIEPFFIKYGLEFKRHSVTYCQYGDNRMKPTDIWTNCNTWKPRPMCKNGDSCHVAAPRGAKTGTQGLKGSYERSIVPRELCEEIVEACEVIGEKEAFKVKQMVLV